jgi:hypothetical protein
MAGRSRLPLERAIAHEPSLAIVELGFYEVLEAAVAGRPADLPDVAAFRGDYGEIVAKLRATGANVLLLTVPDPVDTAYFSSLDSAAANLRVEQSLLVKDYGLAADDQLSVPALMEMGFQIVSGAIGSLPPAGVLKRSVAAQLSERVKELNAVIKALAAQHGAEVFDLAALLASVAKDGVRVGTRTLTADFLGGFYLLNGYYPGATGHAVIANALIDQLNERYGSKFGHVDLAQALLLDPAAEHRPAAGPVLTGKSLRPAGAGVTEVAGGRAGTTPVETRRAVRSRCGRCEERVEEPFEGALGSSCRRDSSRRCRSRMPRATTGMQSGRCIAATRTSACSAAAGSCCSAGWRWWTAISPARSGSDSPSP